MSTSYTYVTSMSQVNMQEKEDVKKLSEQLSLYVERVRKLGSSNSGNSATFLATLRSVEEEVFKLKSLYESELESLRCQLEEATKTKYDSSAEIERYQRSLRDYVDRFQVESDKNGRLINDILLLKKRVSELEHELKDARDSYSTYNGQQANLQGELDKARSQITSLTLELEHHSSQSSQLSSQVASLQQQLAFKEQLYNEQLKEAGYRIEESKAFIVQLENKAKQNEYNGPSLQVLLDQMKKKTEEELRVYKEEMKTTTSHQFSELKIQMDGLQSTIDHLRQVNAKLQADYDIMVVKVNEAEVRVRESYTQKSFLEGMLKQEKARAAEQIRELEVKLHNLQTTMTTKMTEINTTKDVQVSLRAEIEAMRLILVEEENRLGAVSNMGSQQCTTICTKPADKASWFYNQTQAAGKNTVANPTIASGGCVTTKDFKTEPTYTKLTGSAQGNTSTHGRIFGGYNQGKVWQSQSTVQLYGNKGGYMPYEPQMNTHSVVYKQTRARSSSDGFPKIPAGSKTAKPCDIKGDGSVANSTMGTCRYGRNHIHTKMAF